jgi:hypothetical protein
VPFPVVRGENFSKEQFNVFSSEILRYPAAGFRGHLLTGCLPDRAALIVNVNFQIRPPIENRPLEFLKPGILVTNGLVKEGRSQTRDGADSAAVPVRVEPALLPPPVFRENEGLVG